jgi:GH25 family lysozyme M1 (1,4-beta-N-acetylmuramidase)
MTVTFADVSHHQTSVDLAAYQRAGHDRIVLKATEGTAFIDPAFASRWREAGRLGLARVAYHYARARFNGADEFDHFWQVVQAAGGLTSRDRLGLDVEDPDTPTRAAVNAQQFALRAVEKGITRGLVYTYRFYAVHNGVTANLFPAGWRQLWLADYTAGQSDADIEVPAGWSRAQIVARQYTDKATVAGIAGLCDASRLLDDWLSGPTSEEDWFDMATLTDLAAVIDARLDAKFPATGGITETVAQRTRQVIADGSLPYGLDRLRSLLAAQGSTLADVAQQQGLDTRRLVAELDEIQALLNPVPPAG